MQTRKGLASIETGIARVCAHPPPIAVCHVVYELRSYSGGGHGNACMLDLFQRTVWQFRRDLTVKTDRLMFPAFSFGV